MSHGTILAQTTIPAGCDGYRVARTFIVRGGLHYIKGNVTPYFSLTCEAHRKDHPDQLQSGGADHVMILSLFPQFARLADLHMADIDGAPMHAEVNGWYWIAGAAGGLGERFHAGNASPPADREACARALAAHLRISREEADSLIESARAGTLSRRDFGAWIEAQRPRWKIEAAEVVRLYGLRVFGDPWSPAPGVA